MSVIIRKGLPEDIANALHLVKRISCIRTSAKRSGSND